MYYDASRNSEPQTFTNLSPRALSAACSQTLSAYKHALLKALLEEYASSIPASSLENALNDAEALASLTPFPSLFLPALAEEKISAAQAWANRQRLMLSGPQIALAE